MAEKKDEKKKEKRPTALKRDMQNKKKRVINRGFKSQVRTAVRHFEENLEKGEPETVKAHLSAVYGLMDKGVKNHVIKPNTASRTKSRLAAKAAKAIAKK
jgi:small subunit ribosomal protein S20